MYGYRKRTLKKNETEDKQEVLKRAKKRALYLLGERAFCRAEFLKKLAASYGEEIASEVIEYVDGLGYLNDEEYAAKYADFLIHRKKLGLFRAKREMLSKGLALELCDEVLSEFSDDELDEELVELIEKRYITKISDFDDRRRTTAALVRRGYDFGSVRRCINYVAENSGTCSDDFDESADYEQEYL